MTVYTISALVTISACLFLLYLAYNVGMTRAKNKAPAYEDTNNREVLIAIRTHMNTLENMAVYLPILWIATLFGPTHIAGVLGVIWLAARILYAFGYLNDPKKREKPFIASLICILLTALLGIYGVFFG